MIAALGAQICMANYWKRKIVASVSKDIALPNYQICTPPST